jgi:hypothetical protein
MYDKAGRAYTPAQGGTPTTWMILLQIQEIQQLQK